MSIIAASARDKSLVRIRLRVANQSLALLEQSGEFRPSWSAMRLADALLICRARNGVPSLLSRYGTPFVFPCEGVCSRTSRSRAQKKKPRAGIAPGLPSVR